MFEELAIAQRALRYARLCEMIEEDLSRPIRANELSSRILRRDYLLHRLNLLVNAAPPLPPEILVLH